MLLNPAMKKESLEYDYVRQMAKEKPFGETIGSFVQFVKQNDNETISTVAELNAKLIENHMIPFMPIISKEIAITEHRKMWEWIAHETHRTKNCATERDYFRKNNTIFNLTNDEFIHAIENTSFACQYCRQILPLNEDIECFYCPFEWGPDHKNYQCEDTDLSKVNLSGAYLSGAKTGYIYGDGLHAKWQYYTFEKKNAALAADVANTIATLKPTKTNAYDVACMAYVQEQNEHSFQTIYEAITKALSNGLELSDIQKSIETNTFSI